MTAPLSRRLALALLVAALALGCKKTKTAPTGDGNANPVSPGAPTPDPKGEPGGPPAGWSEARDPIGGFRVLVAGTNRALNMTTAPDEKKQLQMTMYQNAVGPKGKGAQVTTYSLVPPAGFKIGSKPDELYAALLLHQKGLMTFQDVLSKESIKLGGRPALKVLTKANNLSAPPVLEDPEATQRIAENHKKDVARRRTYFVTTTATRVIVLMVQSEGDPDPAELKTIADSFAFL